MNILTISTIVVSTVVATLFVVKIAESVSDYNESKNLKESINKLTISQVQRNESEISYFKRQIDELNRKNSILNRRQTDMHFILLNIDQYRKNYEKLLREREDYDLDVEFAAKKDKKLVFKHGNHKDSN